MSISARDDSLSWPMHALLYVCSRLNELALLSHSQLVADIVADLSVMSSSLSTDRVKYEPELMKGFNVQTRECIWRHMRI